MKLPMLFVFAVLVALVGVACPAAENDSPSTSQPTDSISTDSTPTNSDNSTLSGQTVLAQEPELIQNATPRQLTSGPGQELDPAWDPRGGVITFMTTKPGTTERPYDIGKIGTDGRGQTVLATGPNVGIGIAGELSWVGETGLLMTNERISMHSYMTFDTAQSPFNRSGVDGDDSAFKQRLLISGGMAGDGLSVSRDGKTVMWMIRTSHSPANWVGTVRTAPLASLNGQSASDFGTVLLTHSAATGNPDLDRGFSMAPNAEFFVISLKEGSGYDLSLRSITTGEEIRRLTTTGGSDGVFNLYPDVSPDGKTVAFSSQLGEEGPGNLQLIGIDGSSVAEITNSANLSDSRPSWSPDGSTVAFQRMDYTAANPNWDIYVIDVFRPMRSSQSSDQDLSGLASELTENGQDNQELTKALSESFDRLNRVDIDLEDPDVALENATDFVASYQDWANNTIEILRLASELSDAIDPQGRAGLSIPLFVDPVAIDGLIKTQEELLNKLKPVTDKTAEMNEHLANKELFKAQEADEDRRKSWAPFSDATQQTIKKTGTSSVVGAFVGGAVAVAAGVTAAPAVLLVTVVGAITGGVVAYVWDHQTPNGSTVVETGFSESAQPVNMGDGEGTLIILPPNAPPVVLKQTALAKGKETKFFYEPPPYNHLTPELLAEIEDSVVENVGISTGDGFCDPPLLNDEQKSSNSVSGFYEGCRRHGGQEFAIHLTLTERPQSGTPSSAAEIVGDLFVFGERGSGDLEDGYIKNCSSCSEIRVAGSEGYLSFTVNEAIPGENNDVQCNYVGTVIPEEDRITGNYVCITGPIDSSGGDWIAYRPVD